MSVLNSIRNIFKIPELKNRVLFTLAMLAVYRISAHIPTPGINGARIEQIPLTAKGGAMMGFFDMFSGGALSQMTIMAWASCPISAHLLYFSS